MKNYNHISSPVIDKIESRFTTRSAKTHGIPMMHEVYETIRYQYLPAGVVYRMMMREHARYRKVTDVLKEDAFTEWYNEMLRINRPTIEAGMPCTVHYSADCRAATVTKVEYYEDGRTDAAGNPIPSRIGTNMNKVKCIDYYAGEYEIYPLSGRAMKTVRDTFTLRKNGHWVGEGQESKDGCRLEVGVQRHWSLFVIPNL